MTYTEVGIYGYERKKWYLTEPEWAKQKWKVSFILTMRHFIQKIGKEILTKEKILQRHHSEDIQSFEMLCILTNFLKVKNHTYLDFHLEFDTIIKISFDIVLVIFNMV